MTTLYREETVERAPAPGYLSPEPTGSRRENAAPLRCGYGACAKCNCRHYEGNEGTCANQGCGHAYQDHW